MYISSNPSLPIRSLLWPNGNSAPASSSALQVHEYSRAREALADFVGAAGMKPGDSILLPAYICGTVLDPFKELGVEILFYPIDEAFAPQASAVRELLLQKPRAILFVHYFGFAPESVELIEECRQHGLWIIEDCAHTLPAPDPANQVFFGDLAIYSLPKLLPLPDGALAVIRNQKLNWPVVPSLANKRLTRVNSLWQIANTMEVLAGVSMRTRLRSNRRSSNLITDLRESSTTQDAPRSYNRFRMSGIANWIKKKIDLQVVAQRRKENYELLFDSIKSIKGVRVAFEDRKPSSAPLGLPVLVKDRELVRSRLVSAGVDPRPIWSGLPRTVPRDGFDAAHYIAAHNIVLPVHQGLNVKSIAYIACALEHSMASGN